MKLQGVALSSVSASLLFFLYGVGLSKYHFLAGNLSSSFSRAAISSLAKVSFPFILEFGGLVKHRKYGSRCKRYRKLGNYLLLKQFTSSTVVVYIYLFVFFSLFI